MRNPPNSRAARHRAALFAAPVLLLGLALAGCRSDTGASAGDGEVAGPPTPGGTVVVGVRTDFGGFNPITNNDQYTDEVIKYALFTPLVRYNERLEIEPYLAESWELLGEDGVVFHLRKDVRWHDGRPVTAEDVKFTFDLAKDPSTASLIGSAYLPEVASAEVVDSHTIRFTFTRPHAQALEDFWWAPVPKHLLEGVSRAELRNAAFNRNPVGSGPYRFVEWRANDRVVLERNPEFPEALGGPPHLDRVVFRVIPEPATMLTELMTGGVQVDIPVAPAQVRQIESGRNLSLFSFPSRTVYYLGWNTRRAPFDRAEVRQALAHAVDSQEIIDALLYGFGTPATSPIPPLSPFHPTELGPTAYDPARAAALLDSAGWGAKNAEGIRTNAAGQPLRFQLLVSDDPLNRAVVEVVQAHLRKIGVDARIQVLEFQTLLAQHRGRDFDAVFHNWVLDNFQVAAAPAALFHSRWAATPGSANRSSYANPRADTLLEEGAATTDPAAARRVWAEFTGLLQQEQPITFLFWKDELAATQSRVQGVTMDPRGKLVGIAGWWLPARS
jgi:peptide/nickel transport system substrate-binding protein